MMAMVFQSIKKKPYTSIEKPLIKGMRKHNMILVIVIIMEFIFLKIKRKL